MKNMSVAEMQTVNAGGTVKCYACCKTFKDSTLKWFNIRKWKWQTLVLKTGESKYYAHKSNCFEGSNSDWQAVNSYLGFCK